MSGSPYWRERTTTTWQHAAGRVTAPFISAAARDGIVREARILLGVYSLVAAVAVAAQSVAPVYYWVLPVLLGQPFLRMYLLAEHTGCSLLEDMRVSSRTTLTNWAMRWLAWNMPFHTAHHVYRGVPFHALPEVHRRIRDGVHHETLGYVAAQKELTREF